MMDAGEFNYVTLTPGGMLLNGSKTIPVTENFKGDFKTLQIEEFNLNFINNQVFQ